jgi:PAS domain S-box-containing protein
MGDRPREPATRAAGSGTRGHRKLAAVTPRHLSTSDWATSEHLRALVDNSTTCIYVKDAAGRYLLINRQYELLFHVSRADFVGRTDYDVFPEDVAHALRQNDLEVMQRNEAIEFEEVAPHDDGPHTYISIKVPLRDEHGRVEGICGISTDITQRLEAERQLRRLAQQLVTVREEERQRLSFRIHDEICQELTGITFMLAAASRRLAADGGSSVLALSSPRLTVDVDVPDDLPVLSPDVALGIYRIAQEAVLNAVRHADTHAVRVGIRDEPTGIRLLVADDGRGFDTRATASRSLGLLGMEQRALAVGGTLEIDSAPGRGTRVVFTCPLGAET